MRYRSSIVSCSAAVCLACTFAVAAFAQQAPSSTRAKAQVFEQVATNGRAAGLPVVKVIPGALDAAKTGTSSGARNGNGNAAPGRSSSFVIERFPLTGGENPTAVDLLLEEFKVTTPETRFVRGQLGGPDLPLDFDPSSITFLRGTVVGYPASHIFMAISDSSSTARIDLGPGHQRYLLSSRTTSSAPLGAGEMVVFPATDQGQTLPGVPMCGVEPSRFGELVIDHEATQIGRVGPLDSPVLRSGSGGPALRADSGGPALRAGSSEISSTPSKSDAPAPPAPRGAANVRGLQQLQLAVETDYEFFELFGNESEAATYVAQLYAAVSDIYIRDVNTRVVLSFVRIWPTPADMFNQAEPLDPFRIFWNDNMQAVPRDTAQFLTGRRNLSAGGVAWVASLCGGNGYSWSGYTLGFFGDPVNPSWTNRDIVITAHEIGHNCATLHTHDYQIDTCHLETSQPQRGSIMSYCGQTYSGGDANHDLWFHETTAQIMRDHIFSRTCVIDDCNANNIADAADIANATSADANQNSVPDECEDCNGNGILDSIEIAAGSPDVNTNGVLDSCEPDCNANGIPDTYETNQNPAIDLNRNRVPDLCEGDSDSDGISDYNEIQQNMTLDKNRNIILDSSEDCDNDGINDLNDLDHAWNCYVGSASADSPLRECHAETGVQMNVFGGPLNGVQDLIITSDGRILVSTVSDNMVREFDRGGALVRVLIGPGNQGLSLPAQMVVSRIDPTRLLVVNAGTNQVREYNINTGAFIRVLVGGANAPADPFGIAYGPNGNLYVTSRGENSVREYNAATGAFVRVFVSPADDGGLVAPYGLLFKPDGNLLVCSWDTAAVLEYNGQTGAFMRQWSRVGTATRLTFENPWCIRLGPDGDVYVTRSDTHRSGGGGGEPLHLTNARIYQFDIRNGNFVRAYLQGVDSQLNLPTGFDFMPGDATDCNQNRLPDNCDIAAGRSLDCNANGIPDDCDIRFGEPDINNDGVPDTCQCLADFNHDGFENSQDFFDFVAAFFAGTPSADFNGDHVVNSQDFFDFLAAFFTGC